MLVFSQCMTLTAGAARVADREAKTIQNSKDYQKINPRKEKIHLKTQKGTASRGRNST